MDLNVSKTKISIMNTSLEYSRRIYVSTNFSCNLNCVYCFEKNKNDIEFDVAEAVSILEKMLMEKTEHGTKIKLHGGEPFLVFPNTSVRIKSQKR